MQDTGVDLTPNDLPLGRVGRKLLFNEGHTRGGIEIGGTAKHVNVNSIVFRVRMSAEMALGQDQNAS